MARYACLLHRNLFIVRGPSASFSPIGPGWSKPKADTEQQDSDAHTGCPPPSSDGHHKKHTQQHTSSTYQTIRIALLPIRRFAWLRHLTFDISGGLQLAGGRPLDGRVRRLQGTISNC